jgi:hypothetical protein
MMQQGRGGSGFLGTAMMTAVGVAGGLVLGNALMGPSRAARRGGDRRGRRLRAGCGPDLLLDRSGRGARG